MVAKEKILANEKRTACWWGLRLYVQHDVMLHRGVLLT